MHISYARTILAAERVSVLDLLFLLLRPTLRNFLRNAAAVVFVIAGLVLRTGRNDFASAVTTSFAARYCTLLQYVIILLPV